MDFLVGLYYDIPSKRFKNNTAEHIVYGWQPDDLPESENPRPQSIQPLPVFESSVEPNVETYADPSTFQHALPDTEDYCADDNDLPF